MQKLLFLAFVWLGLAQNSSAQASLAAENIIDDVKVTVGNTQELYTLFRDARNEDQWYYMPNRPRLLELSTSGGVEPVLSLVRYQFPDPSSSAKLVEEGILQFAATLSAPPAALQAFKNAIKARTGKDVLRISAIPFKSADVALYTYPGADGKSRLLSATPHGTGLAPLFASQSMAFSLPLSRMGTDVLDTLVKGNTGLPVAVTFSFNALTPPAGFKVTVDYSQLYSHYSKDERFRASASYFGWFGASYDRSAQSIREELINSKSMKIEVIAGEQFSISDVDKYLQPILARINNELIEASKPPAEITPATASRPSGGGWLGGGGYSVAIRDITKVKKGTETWDMRVQQIVERKTVAQGFIGLGGYSDDVKAKSVTVVPNSGFKSAYLMLPLPSVAEELGITNIDMQVSLMSDKDPLMSKAVMWAPKGKWKDIEGVEQNVLAFPLTGLKVSDAQLKQAKFRTKVRITTNRQLYEVDSWTDAFNGQQSMPGITGALFDVVEINGDRLSFPGLSLKGDVFGSNITVKTGGQTFHGTLKPKFTNGQAQLPEPFRVLVAPTTSSASPITVQAMFQTKMGLKGWKYNGADVRSKFGGLSIDLLDEDIEK